MFLLKNDNISFSFGFIVKTRSQTLAATIPSTIPSRIQVRRKTFIDTRAHPGAKKITTRRATLHDPATSSQASTAKIQVRRQSSRASARVQSYAPSRNETKPTALRRLTSSDAVAPDRANKQKNPKSKYSIA